MTGFFSGIIGSLIGAGIQAAVGGIPVSEDASKALDVLRTGGIPVPPANWFSPTVTKEQSTQQIQIYDDIGKHMTGAHQLLSSCIKISKVLEDVAYPRSTVKLAEASSSEVSRFARNESAICKTASVSEPVPLSAVGLSKKYCRCLHGGACETTSYIRKPIESSIGTTNMEKEDIGKKFVKNRDNSLPRNITSQLEKGKKVRNDILKGNSKRDKFINNSKKVDVSKHLKECHQVQRRSLISRNGDNQFAKSQNKYNSKPDSEICQICHVHTQKRNKLILMPCGHRFCRGCLTGKQIFKCPKCGVKLVTI